MLHTTQKLPELKSRLKSRNNMDANPEIAHIINNWNSFFFSWSDCETQSFVVNICCNILINGAKLSLMTKF